MLDTYNDAMAVTPADGTPLVSVDGNNREMPTTALVAATSGTVKVKFPNNTVVTLYMNQGVVYPFKVTEVWATGTTATGIVALFRR
jgi:hypothetical protein